MHRIFILESRGLDYSAAKPFGEVVCIFEGDRPAITTKKFQTEIRRRLELYKFEPESDYVIVSGAAINMHIYASVLAGMYEIYRVLVYSPQSNEYFPLEIGIEENETANTGHLS